MKCPPTGTIPLVAHNLTPSKIFNGSLSVNGDQKIVHFSRSYFYLAPKSLTLGHNNDFWPSSDLSSPWKHHTLKDGSNSNTKGQIN